MALALQHSVVITTLIIVIPCLGLIVYPDGRVCISILHAPGDDPMGYESSAERWSPVQSVEKILLSVVSMLAGKHLVPFCLINFFHLEKESCIVWCLTIGSFLMSHINIKNLFNVHNKLKFLFEI